MRRDVGVKAVHDTDLERVLDRLGILDDVRGCRLKCAVCDQPVCLENLGCIFARAGQVMVTCDQALCVSTIAASQAPPRPLVGQPAISWCCRARATEIPKPITAHLSIAIYLGHDPLEPQPA